MARADAVSFQLRRHRIAEARQAARADPLAMLADRQIRSLAVARALILAGRYVDLSGMQDGIGMLCATTLDLPHDQARSLLPALHELVAQIEALSSALGMADGGCGGVAACKPGRG